MGTTSGLDVVAVVSRAASMDLSSASLESLSWADQAADRVIGWFQAWQAQVHFELTVPRPLPPDSAAPDDRPTVDHGSPADPAEPAGSAEPVPAEPEAELPALGSMPQESAIERERKARRAALLAELPTFADALRAGRISTGHVDVLAAALERHDDIRDRVLACAGELLRAATDGASPEQFARHVRTVIHRVMEAAGLDETARQRSRSGLKRGVDRSTGMHWINLQLDAARGAALFERLNAEKEAIFHRGLHTGLNLAQVELQALLDLLATPGSEQQSSTKRPHGSVLIDIRTLVGGRHAQTVCESGSGVPLPVSTVRGLLCEASITYGFTLDGTVVGQATTSALANAQQRRALRMMYRTCCFPGCDVPFAMTQIHHVIFRSRHGPTSTPLLVPLCHRHHHHAVHHDGWALTIDEQRTLTWTAPDGTVTTVPFAGLAPIDAPADPETDGVPGQIEALRLFDEPQHPPAA